MKILDAITECLNAFARLQPGGDLDSPQMQTDLGLSAVVRRAANGMEIWRKNPAAVFAATFWKPRSAF